METLRRPRLTISLAPAIGVVLGLVTAACFLLVPQWRLEAGVLASGIPAVIAAAEPPLGFTARLVLALIGGALVGGMAWFALFVAIGGRTLAIGPEAEESPGEAPVLRRADAHPDAPPRPPLFANRDLGAPFLEGRPAVDAPLPPSVEDAPVTAPVIAAPVFDVPEPVAVPPVAAPAPAPVARELPADLDQPLAAFDPASFHQAVQPAPEAPAAPRERMETFELTPIVRPDPDAPPPPRRPQRDTEATISALLERLERGVASRVEPAPAEKPGEGGLAATLDTLRRLARP
ncbi:hypothetical protein [Sphingomonas sp.]|uniref:hypothetical protein n=1 Tax=Sphingomonas sp. TaxID=28214 RepID=UPI001DF16527|nr:hypothetical protein [Sphingomonas sp.]MBX9796913.1 hypothetical protein [Sphingomonas sp.]